MAMSILLCVIFRDPRAPNELFGKNKNGNTKPKNEKTNFQQKIKKYKKWVGRSASADGRRGRSARRPHFFVFFDFLSGICFFILIFCISIFIFSQKVD